VVQSPTKKLSEIELLGEEDKKRIINLWNSNEISHDQYVSVIGLIEQQARKNGHRLALISGDSEITYSELNNLANQIATEILKEGGGGNEVVAQLMDRSALAIVGILGIWKTSSIYLPLDPDAPIERLRFYLQDSRTKTIITKKEIFEGLNGSLKEIFSEVNFIFVDHYLSRKQVVDLNDLQEIEHDPGNIAYLIYTSGSTGMPKGVVVDNRAFSNHIRVIKEVFRINEKDKIMQFSAFSFDQSIEQIAATLVSGATLFLRENMIWTPDEFTEIIEKNKISVINIQPAYWNIWTRSLIELDVPYSKLKSLKLVIIGGDVILPEHVNLWSQVGLKSTRLLNAYGPTETTITASVFEIPMNGEKEMHYPRVPIGKPLPNRKFFIVGKNNTLLPPGIPGELFIGGDNLAQGYLNQDDLTKQKFIPDPFTASDSRIYRTGDLCRLLSSGDVEFLGRIDTQVKLRGFRIELGEIESALNSHPDIVEAYVAVRGKKIPSSIRDDNSSVFQDRFLAAFVKLSNPNQTGIDRVSDFREHLSKLLPDYMIPTTYVFLDEIPYLISGKVDRRQLDRYDISELESYQLTQQYIAPSTPVETELVQIWEDILGKEDIGIRDNFFDLGGHSLLATQVLSRVKKIYPVELPLRIIFENPTIESIANEITKSLFENELSRSSEDMDFLLTELENMSDEDVQNLLNSNESA